jgi:exodeoxyribonuclease VII large subunit
VTDGPQRSTADEPWPVRVVSQKVGAWISRLGWVWVDGQVAQINRRPGASVVFLTLRDPSADLSLTVTTNRDVLDLGAPNLEEGARVVLHAKPEFYPARGTLSLRADEIRQVGLGELLARLEKLKKLLAAEGLFDPRRKRRPPFLPRKIGLITGRASAAERDVLTNTRRRWPAVEFRVVNVAVQGPTAVPDILSALSVLDADETVDVIILARGGGGVEDLLPFSDEALCRAVFACTTPVISAIGHETDAPLVDYVADVRASTPTDAAKLVVPDMAEEAAGVTWARDRLRQVITQRIAREQEWLAQVRSRPAVADPRNLITARSDELDELLARSRRTLSHRLERAADDIGHQRARAQALSPLATLQRGYAVLQDADGRVVTSVAQAPAGSAVSVRVADGRIHATTDRTETDPVMEDPHA